MGMEEGAMEGEKDEGKGDRASWKDDEDDREGMLSSMYMDGRPRPPWLWGA